MGKVKRNGKGPALGASWFLPADNLNALEDYRSFKKRTFVDRSTEKADHHYDEDFGSDAFVDWARKHFLEHSDDD